MAQSTENYGLKKPQVTDTVGTTITDLHNNFEKIDVELKKKDLFYNVKNYGAAGDGETDDSPAVQNAIDTIPPGSTLYFPPGRYKIASTIRVWKRITLLGSIGSSTSDDYLAQILIYATVGFRFENKLYPGGATPTEHYAMQCAFKDLSFEGGNYLINLANNDVCLALNYFSSGLVEHCYFKDFGTAISMNGCWISTVEKCVFTNDGIGVRIDVDFDNGYYTPGTGTDKYFEANAIKIRCNGFGGHLKYGIYLNATGQDIDISENCIENCDNAGIFISSYAGAKLADATIIGGTAGFKNVYVHHNYFEASTLHMQFGRTDVSDITKTAIHGLFVHENHMVLDSYLASDTGLYIVSMDGGEVRNNGVTGAVDLPEVELYTGTTLIKDCTIIAENGYKGYCTTADNVKMGCRRFPRADYNEIFFSVTNVARLTTPAQTTSQKAGDSSKPLAAYNNNVIGLLPYYLEVNRDKIDFTKPIILRFEAGQYGDLTFQNSCSLPVIMKAADAAGTDSVSFSKLFIYDPINVEIEGQNKIYIRVTDLAEQKPFRVSRAKVWVKQIKIEIVGGNIGSPGCGLWAGDASHVTVQDYIYKGANTIFHSFFAYGGTIVLQNTNFLLGSADYDQRDAGGQILWHENHMTAAPTSGYWRRGTVIYNFQPSEAGTSPNKYVVFGWVCTASGSPGTWKELRGLTGA